jgi:ribokinase
MPDVVALGDVNVDIIAHFSSYPVKGGDALARSTELHCGGSAANTAMALARLGFDVQLISRIGSDPLALKVRSALDAAGVVTASLQRDPAAMTGLMYVVVTPDGERTMLGYRGANVHTDPGQIREDCIRRARLFHLSGYALLAEPQRSAALLALEIACRHDLRVTLDPGMTVPRATLDEMRALLPVVDILLPNLPEAQCLAGLRTPEDCARALLDAGVQVVALKLGNEGCLVATDANLLRVPGLSIEARDSTGAGDHFAAGVLAGYLCGLSWHAAAVLGNAMGARATSCVGAGTGVPGAQEVLSFMDGHLDGAGQGGSTQAISDARHFLEKLAIETEEEERV